MGQKKEGLRVEVAAVLARLGIAVVSDRNGHLTALCPFHDDRTPSWRIRKDGERRGLHHCQSCKEGGDIIHLVQHVRGYATRTAAEDWLRDRFGAADKRDLDPSTFLVAAQPVRVLPPFGRIFKMPAGVVQVPLDRWVTPARRYAEGRGIDARQVDRWAVGYAVDGKLRGRIVLPVEDIHGRLSGYMARAYGVAERRYLYPAEGDGADLDVMFGELGWLVRSDRCVVVTEGALKSLAVERVMGTGLAHAALGGSGLRPMHVAKLSRFKRVVVLTDADEAGLEAGDLLEGALGRHARTYRATLPKGQDADSVAPEVLRAALAPHLA